MTYLKHTARFSAIGISVEVLRGHVSNRYYKGKSGYPKKSICCRFTQFAPSTGEIWHPFKIHIFLHRSSFNNSILFILRMLNDTNQIYRCENFEHRSIRNAQDIVETSKFTPFLQHSNELGCCKGLG